MRAERTREEMKTWFVRIDSNTTMAVVAQTFRIRSGLIMFLDEGGNVTSGYSISNIQGFWKADAEDVKKAERTGRVDQRF